ncbi:MAG: hypothetical protein J6O51_06885 [Bacteroidales bacterium]|nr:hypothetical protein [Bacteroidales bacterium]
MYEKLYTLLTAVLLGLLFPTLEANAQEAGLFNSPKGIGLVFRSAEKADAFNNLTAYVDIYGVATSRCSYPGYKMNFSRLYVFSRKPHDGYSISLYAGPGLSAGYVRDHDKGRGWDISSLMSDNQGIMLGISGGAGCRFDFGTRVALDLSLTAEAGLHLRRNESEKNYSATNLSIYNNGLLQAIYPQLTFLLKL